MPSDSPLLLFYPTSPVHVRDFRQVVSKLVGWRFQALAYEPQLRLVPGISAVLLEQRTKTLTLDKGSNLDTELPTNVSILVIGAVFESFVLDLIAWARFRSIPVAAIEEVAQLGLNQNEINNYDAPFDRLFVASPDEFDRFVALGYPRDMLRTSGLLAYHCLQADFSHEISESAKKLGIANGPKPIVYTTVPVCSRVSIHSKDDPAFRDAILRQIVVAGRRTDRPIVIKLHPSEERVEGGVRNYLRKVVPDAIVIGREMPMDELLAMTGVLVNRGNSQTCLESILRGIPTVIAACGLRTLFHETGGAYVVETTDAIADAIVQASSTPTAGNVELKARHLFSPPEGVAGFIANELAGLLGSSPVVDDSRWDWLIRSVLFVGETAQALRLAKRLETSNAWRGTVEAALDAHLSGRPGKAIERWLDCIQCDPGWFFPHFELAHAYLAERNYRAAIEHAHKAIALHPQHYRIWHELPMRLVIMASHRESGNGIAAAAELAGLEKRSLIDVIPELLLEEAAQMIDSANDLDTAFKCLEHALARLAEFPVNEARDTELRNRALAQLDEIGNLCENQGKYQLASNCYSSILSFAPDDKWFKFALARVRLAQGRTYVAFGILFGISGIPGAARTITERALPDINAAELASLWPTSRSGILESFRLASHSIGLLATALRKRSGDWPNFAAVCLLLIFFAVKHFGRRLIG
jgi:tetratricopeptide (TPR) repeat protein